MYSPQLLVYKSINYLFTFFNKLCLIVMVVGLEDVYPYVILLECTNTVNILAKSDVFMLQMMLIRYFGFPVGCCACLLFELIIGLDVCFKYLKLCWQCGMQCGQYTRDQIVIKLLIEPYFNMLVHRIYSVLLTQHLCLQLLIPIAYFICISIC